MDASKPHSVHDNEELEKADLVNILSSYPQLTELIRQVCKNAIRFFSTPFSLYLYNFKQILISRM